MNENIKRIVQIRTYVLDQVKELSLEQMNTIPAGLSNNIIWHLGHMIAAHQGIGYKRAGLPTIVSEEFMSRYRPGTKPERAATADELEEIKQLSVSTIEKFDEDYQTGLFNNYVPWTTRYGVNLNSIEDAIEFLSFHEGYHIGCVSIIRKLVTG